MGVRINPLMSVADLRAERHARTFVPKQLPPIDQRVLDCAAQGYVPLQIASILEMSVSDVKLMLARAKS